jgi:dTDP-4-amino-4,6-dideoxygalactose transaminase
VHLQEAYSDLDYAAGSFPVAERCAKEFLSLPMFPELSADQVNAVIIALEEAIAATTPANGSRITADLVALRQA